VRPCSCKTSAAIAIEANIIADNFASANRSGF
jgi:hypothetical protein